MSETFLNGKVELHCGDCIAILPTLAENSIDSVCCDPPYHLTSIVKRFGAKDAAPAKVGKTGAYARASAGFMGKQWDGGDIAFQVDTWAQVLRVLKPGAHLVAFSGTRTYHRMACAIEDAGFEIRDQIGWAYGSGFPKSHNVGKGIKKIKFGGTQIDGEIPIYKINCEWSGWGTALKPAWEPIVFARKPLSESTVAANVLKWGTGAINIDGSRVNFANEADRWNPEHHRQGSMPQPMDWQTNGKRFLSEAPEGRWPANIIHDGSEEVVAAFPQSDSPRANGNPNERTKGTDGMFSAGDGSPDYRDTGSAARFFYTAKADGDDRLGSKHPTVKPLDLMQYLVRLVTPKGGTVLDLFAGTGTTGEAAFREGFNAVLIERETEYQDDIRRRMKLALGGPDERARESIKAKLKDKRIDAGPLFAEYNPDDDFSKSIDVAYDSIRERVANGGPGWRENTE